MELYTRILLPKARFSFSYEDRVVMMGSCFAENIGRKLEENKFSVDINPFGTLYNPASVAEGLRMLLRPERFTPGDLFQHEAYTIVLPIIAVSPLPRKKNAYAI